MNRAALNALSYTSHPRLERTADYPYTAEQGDCQADPTREKVWVGSLVHVGTH